MLLKGACTEKISIDSVPADWTQRLLHQLSVKYTNNIVIHFNLLFLGGEGVGGRARLIQFKTYVGIKIVNVV